MSTAVLESIELDNFLSFAAGRVSFITAAGAISKFSIITGPNGSGKSSIYQALKFVLGSNEKDGRYPRWEDFININSDFMRVKATFRLDHGETRSITRVMRKNKTSTFLVDGKPMTAASVAAIIAAMRVSPDNIFSFVSQGQVNAIKDLSARNIFFLIEAGIGIAGLREQIENESQKIEAMQVEIRNLNGQRANRIKMGIILDEKMEKLREKRDLESQMLVANAEKKWAQKEDLGKKIASISAVVASKREEMVGLRVSIESSGLDRERLELEARGIDEEKHQVKIESGGFERERDELKKEIAAWDGKKKSLLDTFQNITKEQAALASEQDQVNKESDEVRGRLAVMAAVKKERETETSKLRTVQQRTRQELVKNQDWIDKRNELAGSLEMAIRDKGGEQQLLEKGDRELDELVEQIEEINTTLATSTFFSGPPDTVTRDSVQQRKAIVASTIERFTGELQDARMLERDLRKQLSKSSGSVAKKRDQLKYMNELRGELHARGLEDRIKGPIFEHLEFDPKHARAIEAVFKKNALLGFVAFSDDDFKILNSLRNKLKVHCFIYMPKPTSTRDPVRDRPNVHGVIDYMTNLVRVPGWLEPVFRDIVRDTIVVESFGVAVSLIKADDRARCVTLDGVAVDSGKHALRSAPQTEEGGILTGDGGVMDDVDVRLTHASNRIAELEGKIEQSRRELQALDKQENELTRIQFILKQKSILGKKKDQILDERDARHERQAIIERTIKDIQARIEDHEKQKPKEFLALLNDVERVDNRLKEIEEEMSVLAQDVLVASTNQVEIQQRHASLSSRRADLEKKAAALHAEIESSSGDFQRVEARRETIEAAITAGRARVLGLDARRATVLERIDAIQKAMEELEIKIKLIMVDVERLEGEIDALESERQYIETFLKDATVPTTLKSIEEYDAIIERLRARLGSVEFVYITDAIEKECHENRRVLQGIESKLDELDREINEIASSSDELKRDYVTRMEGHVKCLQDAINAKFSALGVPFRVILAVNGHFDDPGLSICADFYEREYLPISALSEGQKSIIALALMLTLQDLNPSPICVFDEAHIFLDEANKDLISKLIKNSTEHTQLIMMVPTTSHGFIMTADKIIGVARQGTKPGACAPVGDDDGDDGLHLGPSRIIELAGG